ncbi:DGQHR domain-containing protein [Salmonella enterica]
MTEVTKKAKSNVVPVAATDIVTDAEATNINVEETKPETLTPELPVSIAQAEKQCFFEYPATWGLQGGTETIMMSVPASSLARLLVSDNYGHTLERSQRELNKGRVKKFYQYLVDAATNGTPFIIPPLVGNCDCDVEMMCIGNSTVGSVRFPMNANIKLFDGQHRAEGIKEFIRDYNISLYIPIMLTIKLPLKTRQQFFSDINNNVSKPAATINMVYDGRDDVAQMMVTFLRKHNVFSVITDFEHNIVPSKAFYYVSFKALCDATSKFIGEGDNRLCDEDVQSIWQSWINLTAIDDIRSGTKQNEYKKDYIQFHAVMVVAYGYAIQRLLKEHSPQEVTKLIDDLSINTDTWEREEFFLIKNWGGICVDTSKDRPTILANTPAQRAAAGKLVEAIKRKALM